MDYSHQIRLLLTPMGASKFIVPILVVIFTTSITSKSFCPPIRAPMTTNLTCKLPRDEQEISCSASWLPKGTMAHFQCIQRNGVIRKGKIKCNGADGDLAYLNLEGQRSGNETLPCDMFEDRSVPQIHVYGYQKPRRYSMPPIVGSPDFREIGLSLHNSLRLRHKAGLLEMDTALNNKAQKWAENLLKRRTLDMASERSLGQNIFSSELTNTPSAVSDAVQHWYYGGLASYNWTNVNSNWDDPLALDFSQLVWKSSKKLGIGAASRDGQQNGPGRTTNTIVVAFYFPMGNIVLEDSNQPEKLFLENVSPP